MEEIGYLDFDLRIERGGQGYRVTVLSSPAGQASSDFTLPFSDLELENFVLRMSRTGRKSRRLGTPEFEAARTFGGKLFESVFAGEVRGCLRSSLDAAEREGRGLRLRLHLKETPELVDLPWEYLYSPAQNRFFALSNATPLVRYLDLPGRIPPLTVQPPLRLLAIIASPRDYPPLDVEQEWGKLRGALKELEEAGLIAAERLEQPTLSALQRRLRSGPCHIIHFIGHGAFDDSTQDGVLLLEDQNGQGRVISGQDLGVLLHDHHPMRLVVLNSCEGARTSRTDPFAGTAQSLIQQGMPAVVAMQFEISDQAAIVISHEFYAALASGYPVDAALAEARKAAFTSGSGAEWGTPVLYLRAADARVFGITAPPPAREAGTTATAPATPASPVATAVSPQSAASVVAPTHRRAPSRTFLWAAAGLLVMAAVAFGVYRFGPSHLRPSAAVPTSEARASGGTQAAATRPPETQAPGAQATRAAETPSPAGVAMPLYRLAQTKPTVFSSSAKVYDIIPADDGVWAATSGGLARWTADGNSTLYTVAHGLPRTHLRAIIAGKDETIWTASNGAASSIQLATDGAIASIENYTTEDGIKFGESPRLMLDSDGSVWLAALYGDWQILRFDGSLWRPPQTPEDDPALANVTPQVSSMLRARDESLWIGLWEEGILRLQDGKWTRFSQEEGIPQTGVFQLLEDSNGVMWAAMGRGGLLRFEPDRGAWERVEFQRVDAEVFWISQLPDNSLWASGNDFIARSQDDGGSWRFVASPDDGLLYPRRVTQDKAGRIWVATDRGVGKYEDGEWHTRLFPGELSSYSIGSLYRSPEGKLWTLPEYAGLPSVIDPTTGEVTQPAQAAELSDVISLAFADGVTWAGRDEGLLRVKDGSVEMWDESDGLAGKRVNVMLPTTDTLWIGGSKGLAKLDLQSGDITGKVDEVAGQFVDALGLGPDGELWAATHWGESGKNSAVYRFGDAGQQVWSNTEAPLAQPGAWVHQMAADEAGGMWVASDNGVYRWNGKSWQTWTAEQGGPTSEVFALLPYEGGMLMAGHSGMIDQWDPDAGWRHLRPKSLSGDVLAMQVSDEGSLWLGTGDGLLRYEPK